MFLKKFKTPSLLVMTVLVLGLVAWKQEQTPAPKFNNTDTVPKNREKKIRNLDDALQEIDKGQAELEESMKKNGKGICSSSCAAHTAGRN